ncbi:MAG: hypothetical protein D6775_00285 [Caldilineae bacterium]|nr:MAG: hypothetical protein D6775_00285 [Caldilineae bacterium]
MNDTSPLFGRTLRTGTLTFTFGSTLPHSRQPAFGELVRVPAGAGQVYGVVYDVLTQDDPFVRQVIAASDQLEAEKIADMRERRQSPVEITALAVAYREGGHVYQRIPPRPPATLEPVYGCDDEEVREVLQGWDSFRTILNHAQCPAEELLAACIRHAARCQPAERRRQFLVEAGRELTRQLSADPLRLDAILRRLGGDQF